MGKTCTRQMSRFHLVCIKARNNEQILSVFVYLVPFMSPVSVEEAGYRLDPGLWNEKLAKLSWTVREAAEISLSY